MEIDYEKAYKEALERARRIKNGEGDWRYSDLIEIGPALTEIFPGLAESEDERIRKLLVWQVYRNIEDETNDLAQSVYDGIKGHDPDLEESIEDWKKCLAYLEKQKEQKPAEWSEEDEIKLKLCEDSFRLPQIRQHLIQQGLTPGDMVSWLNSLRPQIIDIAPLYTIEQVDEKVREAQEWSEEDEKMLNLTKTQLRILQSHLSHTHSERMSDMEYSSQLQQIEKCVSWLDIRLKSLRNQPHWKPSKEQMEALNALNCHGALSYVGQQGHLISLYNDIKKL